MKEEGVEKSWWKSVIEKKRRRKRIARIAKMYFFWSVKFARRKRGEGSSTWKATAAGEDGGLRWLLSTRLRWSSSSSEEESI